MVSCSQLPAFLVVWPSLLLSSALQYYEQGVIMSHWILWWSLPRQELVGYHILSFLPLREWWLSCDEKRSHNIKIEYRCGEEYLEQSVNPVLVVIKYNCFSAMLDWLYVLLLHDDNNNFIMLSAPLELVEDIVPDLQPLQSYLPLSNKQWSMP